MDHSLKERMITKNKGCVLIFTASTENLVHVTYTIDILILHECVVRAIPDEVHKLIINLYNKTYK